MSEFFQTTRVYSPEDATARIHNCENLNPVCLLLCSVREERTKDTYRRQQHTKLWEQQTEYTDGALDMCRRARKTSEQYAGLLTNQKFAW
jgi:hypothetical protein